MDPRVTLQRLIRAIGKLPDSIDAHHALDDLENLLVWMRRGGFTPDLGAIDKARDAILARWEAEDPMEDRRQAAEGASPAEPMVEYD